MGEIRAQQPDAKLVAQKFAEGTTESLSGGVLNSPVKLTLCCCARDFRKQNEARKALQFVHRDDKTNKVFHLIIIATFTQSKPNGDKRMSIYKLKSAVLPLM